MYGKSFVSYHTQSSAWTWYGFYDKDGNCLAGDNCPEGNQRIELTVPDNTSYFSVSDSWYTYEIYLLNNPKIISQKMYPTLTEHGVEQGYNSVTIDYFSTSVQKLYKIDDGDWQEYQNEPIRLEIGHVIYAKGIDENGKETRESSYTSVLPDDALGLVGYDGDESTRTGRSEVG